jgi:hypothetical protein
LAPGTKAYNFSFATRVMTGLFAPGYDPKLATDKQIRKVI